MNDNGIYMSRQPTLNVKQVLIGYELLFRSANSSNMTKFAEDEKVRDALIKREGGLGELLKLVESWEAVGFNQVQKNA